MPDSSLALWLRRYEQNRPSVGSDAHQPDRYSLLPPLLERLAAIPDDRVLITIDGPCASGKTTFAHQLSAVIGAPVVHTDDFVIPHAQKTPARLALPGGNADVERLMKDVLTPWYAGIPVTYQPYLCHEDRLGASVQLPDSRFLILEGSYSNLPPVAEMAALRLFLSVDPQEQQKRLLQRGGETSLRRFNEVWIPLEQAYFAAYVLPDSGCLRL